MPSDKAYHLYIQRHLKVLIFGILTLFTVSGFLIISGVLQSSNGSRATAPIWVALAFHNQLVLVLDTHNTPHNNCIRIRTGSI